MLNNGLAAKIYIFWSVISNYKYWYGYVNIYLHFHLNWSFSKQYYTFENTES